MCAHPHAGNIANETRCWDRRIPGTGSFGVSRVGRRSTILRWINAGSSGDGLNQRLYAECLLTLRKCTEISLDTELPYLKPWLAIKIIRCRYGLCP